MKTKLGIVLGLMCVVSFFLYRMGENNKVKNEASSKEDFIKGVVIDESTKQPIIGVSIAVLGTNPRSYSDENGEFLVLGKESDNFKFEHAKFKSVVVSGKELQLVKLQPKSTDN